MAALRASVDRQSHTSASTGTLVEVSGAPLFGMDMFLATPQFLGFIKYFVQCSFSFFQHGRNLSAIYTLGASHDSAGE